MHASPSRTSRVSIRTESICSPFGPLDPSGSRPFLDQQYQRVPKPSFSISPPHVSATEPSGTETEIQPYQPQAVCEHSSPPLGKKTAASPFEDQRLSASHLRNRPLRAAGPLTHTSGGS